MSENIIVRNAAAADRKDFRRLWKACFHDSDAFCNWFFEKRFLPEYSVCLETEGEFASCMQAYPYSVWLRGREIPGAMLCGVSTDPNHRKKGYMGKIFPYEMEMLRQKDILVAPHTPAVLESYFSFGHFPVADASYLECKSVPAYPVSKNIHLLSAKADFERIYPIYLTFAKKYSGMILRSKADFLRKCDDYAADGGKCIAYVKNGDIKGYCFFYQTEECVDCVEAVATDGNYYTLLEGLYPYAEGRALTVKLPPGLLLSCPFGKMMRRQKGVMGLCNMQELLRLLDLNLPYGFSVIDSVIAENNGCFDFKGNPYNKASVFEIEAGRLLQVLAGYHTLGELKQTIKIYDMAAFEEIDRLLPKCSCYIIDEY
ncbi:MAG: GNAT family N-acetyltransferase [Anaerotignum sp.]|nr:GNAT family N-acetyltransferase [Anaerotignum sp.]